MQNVLGFDGICGFTDMHDLALARIEVHFPSLFPMFEFYEVLLKGLGVIFAGYCQIHSAVSSANSLTSEVILSGRSFI